MKTTATTITFILMITFELLLAERPNEKRINSLELKQTRPDKFSALETVLFLKVINIF